MGGVCFASDVDAEILKDLEFFSAFDVIQDDIAMDAEGDAAAILDAEVEAPAAPEGAGP